MNNNEFSIAKDKELRSSINDYLEARDGIPKGISEKTINQFEISKSRLLELFNATEGDWGSFQWQLDNKITDVETLSFIINLSDEEKENIKEVGKEYKWGITPYYCALLDPEDKYDPIRLLCIPSTLELQHDLAKEHANSKLEEGYSKPTAVISRRYPDRVNLTVTNGCTMVCRSCKVSRTTNNCDTKVEDKELLHSLEYIRWNSEIRDVIIDGGDPLTLSDSRLEWILAELKTIPHVEFVRINSRSLATLPQRITDDLIEVLKKYHPLYLNTYFHHPKEITLEVKEACDKLASAGIPLCNQTTLLNGINNDKFIIRLLNHELLKIRSIPYYLVHGKYTSRTHHFATAISDGLEILEYLVGYTSGLAIPTYVLNSPNGEGKIPMMPQYIMSQNSDFVTVRTWDCKIIKYKNYKKQKIKDFF